jgi:hypothetical protein
LRRDGPALARKIGSRVAGERFQQWELLPVTLRV